MLTINGKVIDEESAEGLFYATINVKNTFNYALSDEAGQFMLQLQPGVQTLIVQILGYQQIEVLFNTDTLSQELIIALQKNNLKLKEVEVSAQRNFGNEGSSSYLIKDQAIKQVQPTHLGEILQLLPGAAVKNPNITNVSQVHIRTTESVGGHANRAAFGTAIIVDGMRISNDANMQAFNPASSDGALTNVANRGVDLREITASNIESIEVVTGVPSAKHGNITSGAVIVKRKAGLAPFSLKVNTNPNTVNGTFSKGFRITKQGFLNTDIDYAFSNQSMTDRKYYYQRINLGTRWSSIVSGKKEWANTLSLNWNTQLDGER